MSTFYSLSFARPSFLAVTDRTCLLRFLADYRPYLQRRKVSWEVLEQADQPDAFADLAAVLIDPVAATPRDLIDAMFIIDELSSADIEDDLRCISEASGLEVGESWTTFDQLLALWPVDPDALRNLHLRQATLRPRTFVHFMADESLAEPVRCPVPTDNQLLMMNHSADVWFTQQRCGGGSQFHLTVRGCEWWFLVRHGERMSRFIAVNHDGTRSVHCFRPERFDLIVYNTNTQELRINAESAGRRDFYRRTVGSVLFGRTNHFPNENKYSLSPIIARRRDALVCTDVPGIFRVHLDALRFVFADDPESRVITYSNGDVLSLVERGRLPLPDDAHLLQATFKMQIADRRTPLSVTIKPPNVAQYVRGAESAIVEQWLNRRQFIRSERNQGYGQTEYHLALH